MVEHGTCGYSSSSTRPWKSILLVGGDKEGSWANWYRHAIRQAEDRYEAYQAGTLAVKPFEK